MPLADEVTAFLSKTGQTAVLDDQIVALCHVLDEKLAQKIDKLPTRYAEIDAPVTAMKKQSVRRPG